MDNEVAERYREFLMPDVGEGLTEAEILRWLVQPGDTVSDGQMVVEVETAKAAVELPIPFDGTVRELHAPEGATVNVGTPIITVDTRPDQPSADPGQRPAAAGGQAERAQQPAGDAGTAGREDGERGERGKAGEAGAGDENGEARQPVLVGYGVTNGATRRRPRRRPVTPPATPAAPGAPLGDVPAARQGGERSRPLAKPPVRKLAKDLGVDLATVTPTGPGGVITREDVRAAAAPPPTTEEAATPAATEAAAAEPATPAAPVGGERRVPIRGVRKATAQAMVGSAFTAPHVTEFVTVDVTRTVKLVERLKNDPDMGGARVTPLLIVAKALLLAIRRNPEVNATWDEERQEIVYKDYVNLGIAAATPRGLIVPNIKNAHTLALPDLARALSDLVTTAREGKTSPADMTGGTVTITNIGVFGIDTGTPILNPGESAILAFGAIRRQPWVHKGKVVPRHVTTLALSFDHRLVDGELGSRVLADVAAVLERPRRLLVWG